MDRSLIEALNGEREARRAAVLVTQIATGEQRLVRQEVAASDPLSAEIEKAMRSGKSGMIRTSDGEVFLNAYLPPARIVVVGAVHITQALAPIARLAGYDLEIIDPRTAFASAERFPDVTLHAEWPQDVLEKRPLDAYTALCVITHDPKIDDHALIAGLDAGCFYIGALGSRKTHANRRERLADAGVSSAAFDRIDAPIGADIAAATPGEIAVAIMASIVEAFRRRPVSVERQEETAAA